jgi:uncharacterized cupin superfamily protein
MSKQELTNTCKDAIEQVINGEKLSDQNQTHVNTCPLCKEAVKTVKELTTNGAPADFSDEFSGLKQKVMQRILPIMNSRYAENKSESIISSWLFKLSLAGAALLILVATFFPAFQNTPAHRPGFQNNLPIQLSQSFKISVNGKPFIEASLDNPISIFNGETAEIQVPDGSTLKVTGPARLNVAPRGFHLVSGTLIAKVAKHSTSFTGTTPHGTIEVLGTVYSCESTAHKTVVKVIEGKVRVTPDNGSAVILQAGETTEMSAGDAVSSDSETIPSINSE